MNLSEPQNDDSTQKYKDIEGKLRRYGKWKLWGMLICIIIAVTYYVILDARPSRRGFVGNTDPLSGYQCRFSVSNNWIDHDQRRNLSHYASTVLVDQDSFTPKGGNWISSLLSRLQNHGFISNPPVITLTTNSSQSLIFQTITMQAGYPEPNLYFQENILSERHLMIDGFPATVLRSDRIYAGRHYRGTILLASLSGGQLLYQLDGWNEASNVAQAGFVEHEMEAIISSFHIKRVNVHSG